MQYLKTKLTGLRKRTTSPPVKTISPPLNMIINSQNQFSAKNRDIKSNKYANHKQPSRNNMHHVIIIWFEPAYFLHNDFQQTFDKLNMVCYKVDVFTTINECIDNLAKIGTDSKVYLLMPGMWAVEVLHRLPLLSARKSSIDEIFIYSSSPQRYEHLREQNLYIQKIYASIDEVESTIHQCIDKCCEVLRFYDQRTVRDLSSEDTTAAFVWFIAFKDALFYIPRDEKSKDDMLNVCRRFYSNNKAQLALIDEFTSTYRSEDAPKWFSRSSFLYKLTNRALRTQDVEQLYVFRYFIRDLSSWLSREFKKIAESKESFFLYRGAALSQDDFQSLDTGKLLTPNGFFSTSRDITVAKLFIGSSRPDTVRVLYKIKCDMLSYSRQEIKELAAFADISESSHMPDEKEVLFDLGATFEIEDIEQQSSKNDYFVIHLLPSCEGDHISRDYRQNCETEMETSSAALVFGALLLETGNYTAAQHYFEQLLKDSDDENICDIHHYLGWIHMLQDDYGRAIINFERAHDLIPKSDDIAKARVLNSIGKALAEKGFMNESLTYYERALNLRTICLGVEHDDVTESYANVARLHNMARNSDLALEYYKKSVKTTTASTKPVKLRSTASVEDTGSMDCCGSSSSSSSCDKCHHPLKSDSVSHSLYETIAEF
jgi:tetratricopeptide (TPR) repeat protein